MTEKMAQMAEEAGWWHAHPSWYQISRASRTMHNSEALAHANLAADFHRCCPVEIDKRRHVHRRQINGESSARSHREDFCFDPEIPRLALRVLEFRGVG